MEAPGEPLVPAAHANDRFFKAVFSQPEHANAFFKSHLPPAISARTPREMLEAMPLADREARHQDLHRDYEARFKRR